MNKIMNIFKKIRKKYKIICNYFKINTNIYFIIKKWIINLKIQNYKIYS